MTSAQYVEEALNGFREARRLTYDMLAALSYEQLTKRLPRPELDTFGKHMQEMGDTQESYALGIKTGTMDFSTIRTRIDRSLVNSAQSLQEFLENMDAQLEEIVGAADPDATVTWPEDEVISIAEQLSRLARHEIFHHGQFAAYAWLHGIRFPKRWVETWVLPSHPGELYPEDRPGRLMADAQTGSVA
jgi:hypothetical protein